MAEAAPSGYCSRNPQETVLYEVVSEELETFIDRRREQERPVPEFVEREFRAYLECGIPAHGFLQGALLENRRKNKGPAEAGPFAAG